MLPSPFHYNEHQDKDAWEKAAHTFGRLGVVLLFFMTVLALMSSVDIVGQGYYDLTLGNPLVFFGGPLAFFLVGHYCTKQSETYGAGISM